MEYKIFVDEEEDAPHCMFCLDCDKKDLVRMRCKCMNNYWHEHCFRKWTEYNHKINGERDFHCSVCKCVCENASHAYKLSICHLCEVFDILKWSILWHGYLICILVLAIFIGVTTLETPKDAMFIIVMCFSIFLGLTGNLVNEIVTQYKSHPGRDIYFIKITK